MNIAEVRKVASRLKINLFKNKSSFATGILRTKFRGTGLQFKEHQVYSPGDDVRFIDWKILAKTMNPYVKTFEEERNVEIVVVIDANPSMLMGEDGVSKLQVAIEITSLLYLLSKETNDFIHVLLFCNERVISIPKKNGEEGITQFVSYLESEKILLKNGKINLENLIVDKKNLKNNSLFNNVYFKSMLKHLHHKRDVVVLSDFSNFLNTEQIENLSKRSNVHLFKLISSIDENNINFFSVFSTSSSQERLSLNLLYKKNEYDYEKKMGKKWRKIKIKGPYLDNFISELRKS